jgi:hypothetical protein
MDCYDCIGHFRSTLQGIDAMATRKRKHVASASGPTGRFNQGMLRAKASRNNYVTAIRALNGTDATRTSRAYTARQRLIKKETQWTDPTATLDTVVNAINKSAFSIRGTIQKNAEWDRSAADFDGPDEYEGEKDLNDADKEAARNTPNIEQDMNVPYTEPPEVEPGAPSTYNYRDLRDSADTHMGISFNNAVKAQALHDLRARERRDKRDRRKERKREQKVVHDVVGGIFDRIRNDAATTRWTALNPPDRPIGPQVLEGGPSVPQYAHTRRRSERIEALSFHLNEE